MSAHDWIIFTLYIDRNLASLGLRPLSRRIEALTKVLFSSRRPDAILNSCVCKDASKSTMMTINVAPSLDEILAAKRFALDERKRKTPLSAVRALASMQDRAYPFLCVVADGSAPL